MKALVFHEFGGPDTLKYEDVPDPRIKPNEVLVRVRACALNHLDLFVREGIPALKTPLPFWTGCDIAGEVADVGAEVPGVKVGTHVAVNPNLTCGRCEFCMQGEDSLCVRYGILGEHKPGGLAELVAVRADNVLPLPAHVSYTDAASFVLTNMTAWRMVVTQAQVRAGQDVLIIGVGGGVSSTAVQIAKLCGARVLVTSSSDAKLERAKTLGADVGINYSKDPDWTKAVGSAEFECPNECTIGDGKAKLKLKAKNQRSQAFAGEGLMESLKAGERRLLSYAMDLALTVDVKGDAVPVRVTRVQVSRGLVIQQIEERQVQNYSVRNEDSEPRVLVIEHPARSGWKLAGTVEPVETTPGWHRFRLTVEPGTTATIAVEEVRPTQSQYSVAAITDDQVSLLVRERVISPAIESGLREVLKRKAEIAKLAAEIGALESEVETITRDQQRVRENMQALKGSREERDLLQRYVRQLGDQETRLETVRQQLRTLTQARAKAQADLAAFINGMSF